MRDARHIWSLDLRKGDSIQDSEKEFTELEHLSVREAPLLTGDFLKYLPGEKLTMLSLDELPQMRDTALENLATLRNLRSLSLRKCSALTSHGLNYLQYCPDLTEISFEKTGIDDEGMKVLERCRNCRELDLSGTAITDEGLAVLKKMPYLESLRLDSTRVTDQGLAALENACWLKELSLAETAVVGNGLEVLTKLARLKYLSLENTEIEGNSLEFLEKCKGLERLNIQHCFQLRLDVVENLARERPWLRHW